MVEVNNSKQFCSFQIVLALVDNYMLIITQHNTESKTDGTANTTVIEGAKRKCVDKLNANTKKI